MLVMLIAREVEGAGTRADDSDVEEENWLKSLAANQRSDLNLC